MAARNRSNHRFGAVYKVRLFFLFILLILASWYAKQEYNNPFAPRPFMDIAGSKEFLYIRCYQKLKKTEKNILLFLHPLIITDFSNTNSRSSGSTENLVTLNASENIYAYFVSPPQNWTILNVDLKNDSLLLLPDAWPEPFYSNSISEDHGLTLRRMFPFNNTITGIDLIFGGIRILFLNDISAFSDSGTQSLAREKFDLVILNTTDINSILSIRKILRPKYLITAAEIKNNAVDSLSNILHPRGSDFNFSVFKDSKKRILVEGK